LIAVHYWEVRRFAPDLKCDQYDWVKIVGDELVAVEPVRTADALCIVEWRPV
jgi:hypothetical protein